MLTFKKILLGNARAWDYFLVNTSGALSALSCEPGAETCTSNGGQMPCCDTIKEIGWQLVLGIPGLLTIIVGLVHALVFPAFESPKFLVAKRRHTDAVRVFQPVADHNYKSVWLTARLLHEASEHGATSAPSAAVDSSSFWRFLDLADALAWLRDDPRLRRSTFALLLGFPAIGMAYPLLASFLPQFFRSVAEGADRIPDIVLLRNNLVTSVCTLLPAPFAYWLAGTCLAWRWTLASSTALSGLVLVLFAFFTNEVNAVAFTSLTLIFQNVMYSVLYAYIPERVPAPIRASAAGYLSGANGIAGLCTPIIATYASGMNDKSFVCLSGGLFLFAATAFIFITETRGNPSL